VKTNVPPRTLILLAIAAGLVLFLVWVAVISPWIEAGSEVEALKKQVGDRKAELAKASRERPKLERWKQLSLPADPHAARREYLRELGELMRDAGVQATDLRGGQVQEVKAGPGKDAKKPVYTPLTFTVKGKATLGALTKLFREFQTSPVAHKVKNLTIEPAAPTTKGKRDDTLTVSMMVEALLIDGADKARPSLTDVENRLVQADALLAMRRVPFQVAALAAVANAKHKANQELFALANGSREYNDITRRNIFTGAIPAPPPEPKVVYSDDLRIKRFVFLTDISRTDKRDEAYLRNRITNKNMRLRTEGGFNTFRITDESGEIDVLKARVVRIDPRDVYYVSDGVVYQLHVGSNLSEARRLTSSQVRELGLKVQ
jgi:hypothetical protein